MTFGAWAGTISFGPWWLLYCGSLRRSDPRVHDAFKVVVHGGGPCIVDATGSMIHGPAAVIDPGRRHAAHGGRDHTVILLVAPASRAGRRLRRRRAPTAPGPGHPVGAVTSGLDPTRPSHVDEAVERTLALAGAPMRLGVPTWWHRPEVVDALLESDADERTFHGAGIAAALGVPVDELRRPFDDELGVSVPVAVRWRRLMAALEHLAEGGTIAAAAERGRYADAGHFEHDFVRLFGVAPKSSASVRTWFQ